MIGRPISLEFSESIQQHVAHYLETPVSIGIRRKGKDSEVSSDITFTLSIHDADDDSPYDACDMKSQQCVDIDSVSSGTREAVQLALAGIGTISTNSGGFQYKPGPKHTIHTFRIPAGTETANISLLFKEITIRDNSPPKALVLKVLPISESGGELTCMPLVSTPFFVVAYHLKIETKLEEPYIFFKDKGGKDSGINICVSCMRYDPQSQQHVIVQNRRVTVRPTLLYESGEVVADQNILKSINERENFTITNGKTWLKFRINEVSSHHLKQKFVIQMQQYVPSEQMISDIAPARSVGIDVRSKQNQRSGKSSSMQSMTQQLLSMGANEESWSDDKNNMPSLNDKKRLHSSLDFDASAEIRAAPSLRPSLSAGGGMLAPPPPLPPLPPAAPTSLLSPAALDDFLSACTVLKDFQSEVEKLTMMVTLVHPDHLPPDWFKMLSERAKVIEEKKSKVGESLVKLETLRMTIKTRASGLSLTQVISSSSASTTATNPYFSSAHQQQTASLEAASTSSVSASLGAPPEFDSSLWPSSSANSFQNTTKSSELSLPDRRPDIYRPFDMLVKASEMSSHFHGSGSPSDQNQETKVQTVLKLPVVFKNEDLGANKVSYHYMGLPAFDYCDDGALYLVGFYRLSDLQRCQTDLRNWYLMERGKPSSFSLMSLPAVKHLRLLETAVSPNAAETNLPLLCHFKKEVNPTKDSTAIPEDRSRIRFFYAQGEHIQTSTLEFKSKGEDFFVPMPIESVASQLSDVGTSYDAFKRSTGSNSLSLLQEQVGEYLHGEILQSLVVSCRESDVSVDEGPPISDFGY